MLFMHDRKNRSSSSPANGELWRCGRGDRSHIGDGTTTVRSSPVQVGSLTTWVMTGGGDVTCFATTTGGTLFSNGKPAYGESGLGNNTAYSSPVQVGALTDWIGRCASSSRSFFVIKENGTLWGWGINNHGQLGDGTTTNRSSPVQIGSLTTWTHVQCMNSCAGGIDSSGRLWTWGQSNFGQGGHGDTTSRSSPTQVGALTTWDHVACSSLAMAAITTGGALWSWGRADNGETGHGNTTDLSSPVQVGSLTDWKYLFGDYFGFKAIKTDNTHWTWARNNAGHLGDGTVTTRSSPVQIGSLTDWNGNFSKNMNAIGWVKSDGTAWAWGEGAHGQSGQGNTTDYSSPVQVGSLNTYKFLRDGSRGFSYGMALVKTPS